MNTLKFDTQKAAIAYFGHCWKWIERHYHVQRCYTAQGFRGYFIRKR